MTTPHPSGATPPPGCPAHAHGGLDGGPDNGGPSQRVHPLDRPDPYAPLKLYGPEFAADPNSYYDHLRQYGALAPVQIAPDVTAMLVTDYRAALDLLNDTATWSKDSREWQKTIAPDSQVMPMLGYRPNALFNDGETHRRYRQVISDSFQLVEPHILRTKVQHAADTLIQAFGANGEVDLIGEYAQLLPLMMFNDLFGMPDSYGERLISAIGGLMDAASPEEANAADAAFTSYIMELMAAKKAQRGPDLTSWFMDHPNGLSDEEVIPQIVVTMAAGNEPLANLIGNALSRMLSDDRYYSTLSGGALTARDAINEVLWNDPPMANYSAHYPRRDVFFHGTWVRQGQLVLVSYAAANNQFGETTLDQTRTGGGSHLAWASGPHACPVQRPALVIAMTAIERLTAWLSDIELAVEPDQLEWRSGAFQRALAALPARFTPITPDQAGATPWDSSPSSSTRPEPISTERRPASAT
ncbi:cytochrome P450 [Streptomyces natalensis]|uniref:Cytochrome P450 n=1 Tax=Streptomyces natalensis ATCC 27448 TaxID=1240678 RepID=A0A0D7CSK7_9ACTN|nr:cytochrome P450 [Streptomyces natalensis]KIZ18392.1 cytochrome P450 [Streptomyces natalensis ATCC 27448]